MYRNYDKGAFKDFDNTNNEENTHIIKEDNETSPCKRNAVYGILHEDDECGDIGDITTQFSKYADTFIETNSKVISEERSESTYDISAQRISWEIGLEPSDVSVDQNIGKEITENRISGSEPVMRSDSRIETSQVDVDTEIENTFDEIDASQIREKKTSSISDIINRNSIRSSISYIYDTCYENEDDVESCKIEDFGDELIYEAEHEDNDRRSNVECAVSGDFIKDGGLNLYSTEGNHFLEIVKPDSKYSTQMHLRTNDKILGINDQAVDLYQHNLVLEILRELFNSSTNQRHSLIIERKENSGEETVFEMTVESHITTTEPPIVKISAEICYIAPFKLMVKSVKLIKQFDCVINSGFGNRYVVAKNGRLLVKPLKNEDEKSSIFTCYQFRGLYRARGRTPSAIFIGVFQSLETKTYIMASSNSSLCLVKAGDLASSLNRIVIADPRFFICSGGPHGNRSFESLLYRGSCWMAERFLLTLRKNKRIGFGSLAGDPNFEVIPRRFFRR